MSSNYMQSDGTNGNHLTASISGTQNPTATVDIRMLVDLDSWTPATTKALFDTTGNERRFTITNTGLLVARVEVSAASTNATASAAVTGTPGTRKWIRFLWNLSTGTVDFYHANETQTDDTAVSWSAVGVQQTGKTTGTGDDYAAAFVGSLGSGLSALAGKFYRTVVIEDGTRVLDMDVFRQGSNTFTGPQGRAWSPAGTVTYTDTAQPHTAMLTGVGT